MFTILLCSLTNPCWEVITFNVFLLNYPVISNSCFILKGQTNLCLSFPPTGAEQPRLGDECPLFGHSYPLKDAFEPDQARIGKHSLSSRKPVIMYTCYIGQMRVGGDLLSLACLLWYPKRCWYCLLARASWALLGVALGVLRLSGISF
jgi:hypothetical protein